MDSVKSTGKVSKTRNWGTIVYPESAPKYWRSVLEDIHAPAFISPLHDLDCNPNGEKKKSHYHVMLMFDGPKSRDVVIPLIESFGGVGCEYINSVRGYARYLCHLDNPEKSQYDISDVVSLSGADYGEVISLISDKYKAIKEMITFCNDNCVIAYSDLLDWASVNREDWFRVLCDNGTYVIKAYIKSKYWRDRLIEE